MGLQAAEDRQDINQQRTGGTSGSRGQAGYQEADDRKQQRTGGTSGSKGFQENRTLYSKGNSEHQAADDRRVIKQQRTNGSSSSRGQADISQQRFIRTSMAED